jgi:hypothetical protein
MSSAAGMLSPSTKRAPPRDKAPKRVHRGETMTSGTHRGSCHCGAVRFEAEIDLAQGSGKCNCSFCTKARNWNAIIKPEAFRILSGEAELSDYAFGSGSVHHTFCKHCGVRPFGRGTLAELGGAYVSIALACLDDLPPSELAEVPVKYFDGRNDNWWQRPDEVRHL